MNKFEIKNLEQAVNTTELKNEIIDYVKTFNIDSEESYNQVKEALLAFKDDKKKVIKPFEQEKKLAYIPYKEAQTKEKDVKDFFKQIEEAFSSIITPYTKEQDRIKALAYAKEVQEFQEKQKLAKKELEENGVVPQEIKAPEKQVDTTGLRRTTTYEVTTLNIDAVPKEYLKIELNKTAIINAHKAGIKVAGVIVNEEVKVI